VNSDTLVKLFSKYANGTKVLDESQTFYSI